MAAPDSHGREAPVETEGDHFKRLAIECRVNTEDPQNRFSPQTGFIEKITFPMRSYPCGDRGQGFLVVTPYFDSMIAKILVHGENRDDCIDKSLSALKEFSISGLKTTVPFAGPSCAARSSGRPPTPPIGSIRSFNDMLESEDEAMMAALAATTPMPKSICNTLPIPDVQE
jgi:acetyl/propionyl-CoA carboxylase alpha subunit